MASIGDFDNGDEVFSLCTRIKTESGASATDCADLNVRSRKVKHIPPPLNIYNQNYDVTDRLTEFAIIATSPRSPLMQKHLPIRKRAYSFPSMESIHSYARPVQTPPPEMLSPPSSQSSLYSSMEELESRDTTVTSASPLSSSPIKSLPTNGSWSIPWPKFEWQCFINGTYIKFLSSPHDGWSKAEEVGIKERLSMQAEHHFIQQRPLRYAPNGLRILNCELFSELDESGIFLTMTPDTDGQSDIIAKCSLEHPFFIKEKGWSSFSPDSTSKRYGIPCRETEINDICLPLSHNDSTQSNDIPESFKSLDLTPEDTSAVYALSSMAKLKYELLSTMSPPASPTKKSSDRTDMSRPKRPMNGFMLFAKKFRVECTQMYPGKDNRAISVILGDRWKRMKTEERNTYAEEARLLAEEQKKLHPDCWKRKRSMSTS